ncbi:neuraminidase-like domain-containing protein [Yokenella regensburgei]|uniref:Tc toxin subunit A-related protein n=1 Tax=Yokenella regensburgei TaxID=158877 RepID=UPI0031DBD9F4
MSNDVSQYSTSQMAIALMEERRDMYASYYMAYGLPAGNVNGTPLSELIKTSRDLYEYLLLDTKNTGKVTTTKIAETISSLQTYINRCRDGYEPDVVNTAGSVMANESLPGGFLYDWEQYNQAYSTWAGKERLQYFPSSYISPTLRYNKTSLFNELEQTISQGKISVDSIEKAFVNYLTSYETLAKLKTVSAYQTGPKPPANTLITDVNETIYFVGKTEGKDKFYYYRACYTGKVGPYNDIGDTETFPCSAWTGWEKIGAPVGEAFNESVAVFWATSRLYVCWMEAEESEDGLTTKVTAKVNYLNTSGQWCASQELIVSLPGGVMPQRIWGAADTTTDKYILFIEGVDNKLYACKDSLGWGLIGNTIPPIEFVPRDVTSPLTVYHKVQPEDTFTLSRGAVCKVTAVSEAEVTISHGALLSYLSYHSDGMPVSPTPVGMRFDQAAGTNTLTYDGSFAYITIVDPTSGAVITSDPGYRLYVTEPVVNNTFTEDYLSKPCFEYTTDWLRYRYNNDVPNNLSEISTKTGEYYINTLTTSGISGLLSYATQTHKIERPDADNGPYPINFHSSYGIYFWEIFFYISFLIADRFVLEQNYDAAALWYKYIFSSSGYRKEDGTLDTIDSDGNSATPEVTRYWNVVPLQTDTAWNDVIPDTDDPDAIAMNDPMHFKMAVFLKTVNMLLERGDYCYRQLNRDMLTQARMYYLQASQLLGEKPEINYNNSWPDPTLGEESTAISTPPTSLHADETFNQAVVSYLQMYNGHFLPPPHEEMLWYWDKLEVRAYNLRNNLTLDGQPMSLPMYAEPVSPKQLQQNHTAGNGSGGGALPVFSLSSEFRFSRLLERARSATGNVIQFGAELLSTLEKSDNESMALLLQTQQQVVLKTTKEIQELNLQMQNEALNALAESREGAVKRQTHYTDLSKNWLSSKELDAMNLQTAAGAFMAVSFPAFTAAGIRRYKDQGRGDTRDYGDKGAKLDAAATISVLTGAVLITAADRLTLDSQYLRRREEWDIQSKNADTEVAQLDAQILAQQQQIAMAKKQIELNELERANQDAVYNLQVSRFTGASLQNWMSGRLSALYYQLYDATLSLCQATKAALGFEIGTAKTGNLLTTPVWNDLYQGLLAGEGLQVELQRMENAFLFNHKRGLEVQKNVSLNTVISTYNSTDSLASLIASALNEPDVFWPKTGTPACRVKYMSAEKILFTELDIASLSLNNVRGTSGKTGRFYNIAVTLPGILGPYQDVDATLALQTTGGSMVTISLSQGADDSGMFVMDASTADKYLPFEGQATDSGKLLLSFYHADTGSQNAFVTSLNDAIYQLRYTLKDA